MWKINDRQHNVLFLGRKKMQKFIYYLFLFLHQQENKVLYLRPNRNVHNMITHTQERFN